MKKNCIWGFGYGPPYDEAGKNRVYELSNYFGIYLITTGRINKLIYRNSNSIIFKRNAIGFFLFLVYSLWFMVFRSENVLLMRKPDCYFLFFFSILLKNKIIHIISNQCFYNENNFDYSNYFRYVFPRLKYVGITNKKEKYIIDKRTHNNLKTFHFLPEVNLKKFSDTTPPEISPFVILFASAPLTIEAFENKGIEIMLKGFKRFTREINSKLIIVWRRDRYTNLSNSMKSLINSMDLNDDAVIINDEIKNMQVLYNRSHITILININHLDTPNYPRSLIESLSVGRPIITSSINEISDIILKENVGSVCYSSEDSVYTALLDCYDNYHKKQLKSRHVAEIHFNINAKTKIFERIFN
ncbi:MAG: glycosyltransferase [Desulfobacteraceae bacterium]|nr:glycosyltransferase [Desulfobacteraceae bacterium]